MVTPCVNQSTGKTFSPVAPAPTVQDDTNQEKDMNKRKKLISGLVLAMAFIMPFIAHAQYGGPHLSGHPTHFGDQLQRRVPGGGNDAHPYFQRARHPSGPGNRGLRMFENLDSDDNGELTLDEFLSRPTDHRADRFERMDSDDDDLISLEEYLAKHTHAFNYMDIDPDDLHACIEDQTDTEWVAAADAETRFNEVDVNNDGFIDLDEFESAKTDRMTERFELMDADANGAISEDEFSDALEVTREHHGIRRDCLEELRDINSLLEG
jgi:Ca2+-binding EF-hand superfamily protein